MPSKSKPSTKPKAKAKIKVKQARTIHTAGDVRRNSSRDDLSQFSYMKAPGVEHAFHVGGPVEVYCDHEKNGDRIRGWIKGTVVQVDNKMVAVQFRSNVFLTDGWMVPDRILWYPVHSEHIRALAGKKTSRKAIPDY